MTAVLAARLWARAARLPGARGHLMIERSMRVYRRSWLILVSGFFEPVFYLFSVGIGIGSLVGQVTVVQGRQIGYAAFVAPALLAASAMNGAVYDSTFNVFYKFKHAKLYHAVLSTPLTVVDVAVGEIGWALLRGALYSGAFLLLLVALGLVGSWWALLVVPAAVLIGFAFAAVGMAFTTFVRNWTDFEWFNLALLPMFLFATTFYPLSVYPRGIQWAVEVLPLFHAIELVRGLCTGIVDAGLFGHAAYLLGLGLLGVWGASRRLARLLLI